MFILCSINLTFSAIFIISFLLSFSLVYSSFSASLRCCLWLLFGICVCSMLVFLGINFLSCFCCNLCFVRLLSYFTLPQDIFNLFSNFFLNHLLLRSMLLNYQIFGEFQNFLPLLISYFIQLWSEYTYYDSDILNLLKLILKPNM